jgi:hypothetical protein
MFMALIWVDAPKEPFTVEPYEGANEELSLRLVRLKITLMVVHLFCFIGLLF